jgi:hypothetical protein
VVDAATGHRLTGRLSWSLRDRDRDQEPELLVSRGDRDRAPGTLARPRRQWWARIGTGPGVSVLGAVDANTCLPHQPYLVCWTEGAGLTVWRIDA